MANVQEVRLSRASTDFAPQVLVSALIEKTSERVSFRTYQVFIDAVMCGDSASLSELARVLNRNEAELRERILGSVDAVKRKRALPYMDSDAYRLLKVATEAFLLVNCTAVTPASLSQDLRFILDRVDSKDPRDLADPVRDYLSTVDVTTRDVSISAQLDSIKAKINKEKILTDGDKSNRREEVDRISGEFGKEHASVFAAELENMLEGLQNDYGPELTAIRNMQLGNGTDIRAQETEQFTLLPYLALIKRKLPEVGILPEFAREEEALCYRIAQEKLTNPCFVELIWSYWHEQGMLIQTLNAISRRFQNVRGPNGRDPLAMLEVGYLRPLNNLLWGYIQDEQHRLSLVRRTYEYDHHYGLTLEGVAVPKLRPADSRSKFLEAFHNLLYLCTVFFKQDDDTTVRADAFPILNALKDVHMLLTMGQHNQFGDLTTTARGEMLMQQWLLARPEFRELLPTRESVVYPEPWMERVDAMKTLQGWLDTSVMHFHDLAVYGEQILLSIRFIEWSAVDDAAAAGLWARFWRSKIQGYVYAYHAVTGVDLTASPTEPQQARLRVMQPAELLRQRLASGSSVPALPPGTERLQLPSFKERRAMRR